MIIISSSPSTWWSSRAFVGYIESVYKMISTCHTLFDTFRTTQHVSRYCAATKSGLNFTASRKYTCVISLCGMSVFQWTRTRITFLKLPGTGISRAHIIGTMLQPICRAACAGKVAARSSVTVKMALPTSSGFMPSFSFKIASSNSRVASRIKSGSSAADGGRAANSTYGHMFSLSRPLLLGEELGVRV